MQEEKVSIPNHKGNEDISFHDNQKGYHQKLKQQQMQERMQTKRTHYLLFT
jgi:hypothetical protein